MQQLQQYIHEAMTDIYIHPDRKAPRLKPLKAWRHMQRLIADKEDTEQVFHIIEALNGRALARSLKAFADTESGSRLLERQEYLPPILDDHDWLWKLPEGTVGRAYVEFMERENLTAQGLVDESERFRSALQSYPDDLEWYGKRMRDTHDLFHVLTGYGRDPLGETSLLGFTYSQNRGRGVIFIAYIGAKHLSRHLPKEARVMECLWEGKRNGRLAQKIVQQDVVALLREPLEDVRRKLNVQPPVKYRHALRLCHEAGVTPPTLQAAA